MHEINVVPYIDVMLVLLIIFMVTAPLVTPGVIDLPSVSKASSAPVAPVEVIVKVDRSVILRRRDSHGAVIEEQRVARKAIGKLIRERLAKTPNVPVLIAADRKVRYEAVLDVMDELRQLQVRRVGLLVKPER